MNLGEFYVFLLFFAEVKFFEVEIQGSNKEHKKNRVSETLLDLWAKSCFLMDSHHEKARKNFLKKKNHENFFNRFFD